MHPWRGHFQERCAMLMEPPQIRLGPLSILALPLFSSHRFVCIAFRHTAISSPNSTPGQPSLAQCRSPEPWDHLEILETPNPQACPLTAPPVKGKEAGGPESRHRSGLPSSRPTAPACPSASETEGLLSSSTKGGWELSAAQNS